MHPVRFRLWAAARAAAGTETLSSSGVSIAEALSRADAGAEFRRIAAISTVLVDGRRVSDLHAPLNGPTEAEVLPPFAGG